MVGKIQRMTRTYKEPLVFIGVALLLLLNAAWCYAVSDSRTVLLFSCVLVVLVVIGYFVFDRVQAKLHAPLDVLFLVIMMSLGILYSFVFAPSTVPDEMFHFEASYKLADQLMFLAPTADSLPVRLDDAEMISNLFAGNNQLTAEQYSLVVNSSFLIHDSSLVVITPVSAFNFDGNPPQLKLAPALGIIVAQLLHLGSYPLFYLGRFFNFMFFVVLVFFAVRITPIGKRAMMTIALLPMTLHITSSYSYDAGIIGFSFLLTALCLKAVYEEGRLEKRLCVAIAVVAILLAPCKVIYVLTAFLVLLIPTKRFASRRNAVLFKGGVIALCMVAIVALKTASMVSLAGSSGGGSALDVRGTETGTFYTLSVLLSDPVNSILLFLRTFDAMGDTFIRTVLGGSLGWFQAELVSPWYVILPFMGLLLLAVFKSPSDHIVVPAWHRILCFAAVCVGWIAVMLSMALGHTFQSENVILGVQGRYLIPLLPLLAIALHGNLISVRKDISQYILWGMLLLNVAYLMRLFSIAVNVH